MPSADASDRSSLVIEGQFVRLVALARDQIEQVRAWRNSPEVARYHAERDPISADQQRAWFERVSTDPSWQVTVIHTAPTRRAPQSVPIGVAHLKSIDPRHRKAECGLYIADPAQRSHVRALEAMFLIVEHGFDALGLHKIYGHYLATNEPARRLNAALGMRLEGTMRDELWLDGEFVDYCRVGMLRDELLASQGARFLLERRRRARARQPPEHDAS